MEKAATSEVVELNAPTTWAVRGIDGATRGTVKGTIEPLDEGAGLRVTIVLGLRDLLAARRARS
jgi:hypothetical protein